MAQGVGVARVKWVTGFSVHDERGVLTRVGQGQKRPGNRAVVVAPDRRAGSAAA